MVQNHTSKKKWSPHWHSGGINVKKSGNGKWDARAATQVILKSLDWLEILENGYNLKKMNFSAPKWACQACQISLGGSFICRHWENGKKFHEPSMNHTLKLDFVKIKYLE